jgi:hypothetical protein
VRGETDDNDLAEELEDDTALMVDDTLTTGVLDTYI